MFEALFVAAMLTVTDPTGDAFGDGRLDPPTAAVYRNLAPFDLRSVTITDDDTLTVVVEMGSLANPFELPLGFSLPVIEVYIEGDGGTGTDLLAGSGMRLPAGRTWEYALRLTGEQAQVIRSSEAGTQTVTPEVTVDGNSITVSTELPRPNRPQIYALTGLYDLFGATPWRPLERMESPWAFSQEAGEQLPPPVVDVLATDQAAQEQALATGTLPPMGGTTGVPGRLWLLLMAVGLSVALIGVIMRIFARPAQPQEERAEAPLDDEDLDAPVFVPSAALASERARRTVTFDRKSTSRGGDGPQPAPADEEAEAAEPVPADVEAEAPEPVPADVEAEAPEPVPAEEPAEEAEPDTLVAEAEPAATEPELEPPAAAPEQDASRERREPGKDRAVSEHLAPEERARADDAGSVWDSSALLTEPADDFDFDDELAKEFSAGRSTPGLRERKAVWKRPVPLTLEERADSEPADDLLVSDEDEDPEREDG